MSAEEPVPDGEVTLSRSYVTPFSDVWVALLRTLNSFGRWEVREADPRTGVVAVTTSSPLGRLPLEGSITLSLDEFGRTLLEIRFESPRHAVLAPAARRRARRLVRRLERSLGLSRRG